MPMHAKAKALTPYGIAVLIGLAPVLLAGLILRHEQAPPLAATQPPEVIIDPPSPSVLAASFSPSLVQWGTQQSFKGSGPAGVNLRIQSTASIVDWSLDATANETQAPPMRMCQQSGVHFGVQDWTFTASPDGGQYIGSPSTDAQRLGVTGDQCFARISETGTWHLTLYVDAHPGGPRGYYRDADGRLHFDGWDRRIDQDFQVTP